jgi:hypothetical protein
VDAGHWIALGSALIAGASALVAVAQARSAKAEAASASDSAESARRQTEAIEHQTEMMSHSFFAEQEKATESAGPTFRVVGAELVRENENFVKATIAMVGGQPLSAVTITGRGDEFRFLAPYVGSYDSLPSKDWRHVAVGARVTVVAQMQFHLSDEHADLTLDFACTEQDGSRTWQRSLTASGREYMDF